MPLIKLPIVFLLFLALAVTSSAACEGADTCAVGSEACECTEGGACDQGLSCLSGLCVDPSATEDGGGALPDGGVGEPDAGSPDGSPTGDGDGDGDGDTYERPYGDVDYTVPDCDALIALYPNAAVCERGFRIGASETALTPAEAAVQPAEPHELAGCGIITGPVHVVSTTDKDLSFMSEVKGVCDAVTVEGAADITTVNGLAGVSHILGPLMLSGYTLESVDGLSALEEAREVRIALSVIENLAGLSALKRTGLLFVVVNNALTSLHGLENLREVGWLLVSHNDELVDISALAGLESVTVSVELRDSPGVADLSALDGLSVGDRIELANLPAVTTLPAMTVFGSTERLTGVSLEQLPQVTSVPFDLPPTLWFLKLEDTAIPSLSFVDGVQSLQRLEVLNNAGLSDASTLGSLNTIELAASVLDNPLLDNCDLEAFLSPKLSDEAELTVNNNGGEWACTP